jgi:Ser/Thr protein kinase RdoA (MazF antagonist)
VATPQQGPEADRLGHWAGVDRWHIVEQATAALGLPDASAARVDVAVVLEHLRQPAPFAALVHMDLNPTNALVTPAGVKLVDFEGSIFGHIGVDASFLHYPFPNHSAHWATLPAEVTTEADRAYRRELAPTLPLDRYEQMRAVGAAAALAVRVHRLTKLAADGQPAADRWRRRAQLVQQIRVFEQLATQAECLPNLTGWFAQLADAMTHRWPDATTPPPPLYPAFHPSP